MTSNYKNMTERMRGGFTIVETLVAISILVTVIIGVTTAVQSGISSYIHSKNEIIAFYLAQEGFEQIRNIRDQSVLRDDDWLTGIAQNNSDPCWFGETCIVDTLAPSGAPNLERCTSGTSCSIVWHNPSTGFYRHKMSSPWVETPFRREIMLASVNANEIIVTVTVTWSKGVASREFKARENIFKWHQ